MKSKAAIGNHPIHPMLIPLPIGAFAVAFAGDIATTATGNIFWYQLSFFCIAFGIVTALLAAVFGFVDYFGVKMSDAGYRVATIHMTLNLLAVALYIVTALLRMNNAAFQTNLWLPAMAVQIIAFGVLAFSGWLGGQLAYVHKVGVVETADTAATEIGRQRAA